MLLIYLALLLVADYILFWRTKAHKLPFLFAKAIPYILVIIYFITYFCFMSKLKFFYEFHIEKNLSDILAIIISLTVLYFAMNLGIYFENSKVENKFVNALNDKNYNLALSYICKSIDLSVNNEINIQENILSEYKISKFLDEDKNTFI
jgi:amino acid transporter